MALRLITPPAIEPVSLEEAKAHLRVDHDEDDDLIDLFISAARGNLDARDGWLGRAICTQTWELSLDSFPVREVQLPFAPLQSIVSVKYDDAAAVEQTVSAGDYQHDVTSEPGRLVLGPDSSWPSINDTVNAVRIRYVAGYGVAVDVPAPIRAAILLMVGDLYENRAAQVINAGPIGRVDNPTVQALLGPYRVWSL